jgi:hypothetical protein
MFESDVRRPPPLDRRSATARELDLLFAPPLPLALLPLFPVAFFAIVIAPVVWALHP